MNVGIVGLGLIGGSIGRAAVKKTTHKIFAYDCDENALLKGAMLDAYHEVLTVKNAAEIDLLLLCVYPNAVKNVLDEYAPYLKEGATVMDCAGVKRSVCEVLNEALTVYPHLNFVGGHPMSGREFSGVEHSTATLMEHSVCILVPVHTPMEPLCAIKEFFLDLGADGIVVTTAEEHDKIIAYTSQLAHIVSSAYVMAPSARVHYGFSAGSFRDMTRVAKLNPDMWTELMLLNADNLADEIFSLTERLRQLGDAVSNRDGERLRALLAEGSAVKTEIESRRTQKLAKTLR